MSMIAFPHLLFLTIMYAAGMIAWAINFDTRSTPIMLAGVIVAGVATGMFLGVWT